MTRKNRRLVTFSIDIDKGEIETYGSPKIKQK